MGATSFNFVELNDPVMGGQSSGTFSVNSADKCGVFDGEVKDVPSLKAPGFIKAAADGTFADVSSAIGGDLVLSVRSSTPEYKGFRVAFVYGTLSPSYACSGGGSIPLSRGCFKAKFSVAAGDDFSTIRIPFTDFSDMWSPATGEHTKECKDDSSVCPTASGLKEIKRIEVWAEGALGKVHLEVQSISAAPASAVTELSDASTRPPAEFNSCSGAVQPTLLYGISGRMDTFGGASASETMAESVCCDTRNKLRAEPQFLYEAPDILLFSKMEQDGVTTFYDSVCGVPLFRAPVNRTLAEFQADTTEHGWPSFRPAEVVSEHVITNKTSGLVQSSCGTHLGSFLPDSAGARWCMDLSCIAGNPASSVQAVRSDVTLYKISGNECGEATLDAKYASYAEKFAGLTEGTCASQGYTVADGTTPLKVPVLGQITISKFKKPSLLRQETISCPGSASFAHAKATVSATFTEDCATVKTEVVARAKGSADGSWTDPHNKGVYTVTSNSGSSIALSHLTGNKKYTDKLLLTFSDTANGGCSLAGCSESQVFSVLDMSTNYCNLHDL